MSCGYARTANARVWLSSGVTSIWGIRIRCLPDHIATVQTPTVVDGTSTCRTSAFGGDDGEVRVTGFEDRGQAFENGGVATDFDAAACEAVGGQSADCESG